MQPHFLIGIDKAGRPQKGRASPRHHKFIIGIDEAGRGPLAGPVVVAGIKSKIKNQKSKFWKGIKDSKKLTAKQRERWFRVLTSHPKIDWAVAKVFPKTIDRINIARATNLGVFRIYKKLSCSFCQLHSFYDRRKNVVGHCRFLLDGSLKLPQYVSHEVIIKGDEKTPVISAASIIAKVTRDRIMCRLHKKHPQYEFDIHKGYGTKLHREMIQKFGLSTVHRMSFVKNLVS